MNFDFMTFSVYLRAISRRLLLLLLLHYHLLPECTLSNRWLFKLFCVGLKGSLMAGGADERERFHLGCNFYQISVVVVAVAAAAPRR